MEHPCPWCDTAPALYFSLMAGCAILGFVVAMWLGRGRSLLSGALISIVATVLALITEAFVHGLVVGFPHGMPGLLVGG